MLLEQILRRQEEFRQSVGVVIAPIPPKPARTPKASTKLKIVPPVEALSIEPSDEELNAIDLTDSGVYPLEEYPAQNKLIDLVSLFEKYVPKTKKAPVGAKTMGLPVPEELHSRMVKFIEMHKDKPGSPQTLKELGLMCLGYSMDAIELPQGDDAA